MAQQFVKGKIRADKVVVFLKPTCPYCVLAKDVLNKYSFKSGHLDFIDISGLDIMESVQDFLKDMTGARTVPRVFIGEQCVGGGSDVAELHNSGKLEAMLKEIGTLQ